MTDFPSKSKEHHMKWLGDSSNLVKGRLFFFYTAQLNWATPSHAAKRLEKKQ